MRRVAEGLWLATRMRISNAWVLRDAEGRRFLIDTGHALERRALARDLRAAGVRRRGDLTAILLTHGHCDHAGNAAWARARFSAPVWCHVGDAASLVGALRRPALAGRGAPWVDDLLCRVEDHFPARSPVDATFRGGPVGWGFEAIEVGGHTAGSALLWHEPSGALFSGDCILAGAPAQRLHTRLRLAIPAYSQDAAAAHDAVRTWLATAPEVRTLCAGHGPTVRRGVQARLARLARLS